ncbi:NAD(P) transhydrogenase alpha subunit [Thioalkalivibrio nitratireducens DSM 14787]|uniref:proton-translocating NAD(P)(+) transhydrogenase n=1 Tax=Thioalkalivibrio nitratireducens (strain DSM 14787 / UNIQEM 213 / ALEN2) TaxID=1255043 RepID=L0E1U6_THIND|nr:Re/Si-specific NAD(P)(+) transhydrogenase subunit alpha [Thioalkalivibrio nitratireducens]AGA35180.1 NAD(P) transhydrogenase alpha subunit [Thioalkalivibrio nitratireducens DSM 14787]
MPVRLSVPKETASGERRVALDPAVAARLGKMGVSVQIERGAGLAARFPDGAYSGVDLLDGNAVYSQADVMVRVAPPTAAEVEKLPEGSTLVGLFHAHRSPEVVAALQTRKILSFAMELIPRISRAQSMDALSSQAAVAGYKAALMGADLSCRFFPMLTTAAGTIRPSKVVVIGAGVAGLQAIATARRLGAMVEAYDVRSATKEQVESLGAKFLDLGVKAEGEGGYARELTEEEKKQQQQALAAYIAKADVLITTAAIPGRPSPKLIPASMVEGMKAGAVIVDLAAEGGGNCELTRPGETIEHGDVIIHGPLNIASQVALHASEMYAKNVLNFLSPMLKDGEFHPDWDDEVIASSCLTRDGEIVHAPTREAIQGDAS